MALKKDKEKVLGEVFDENRIREFLTYEAPVGTNKDFHLLERAYRGMQAENFETFLEIFKAEGGDLNAQNAEGRTLLSLVKQHSAFREYAEVLVNSGATE